LPDEERAWVGKRNENYKERGISMGLFKPAWQSKDWRKRIKAIENGALDEATLLQMAKHDDDVGVRYAAARNINSQELLTDLIISFKKPANTLSDGGYYEFMKDVTTRVNKPALLERIILSNCDASSTALSQLNDIECLTRIAQINLDYSFSVERKIAMIQNDPQKWLDFGKKYGYSDDVLSQIKDDKTRMDILKKIARKDKSIHRRNDAIN